MRGIEEVVVLNTPVSGWDKVLLVKIGREEVLPPGVLLTIVVILEVVTVED